MHETETEAGPLILPQNWREILILPENWTRTTNPGVFKTAQGQLKPNPFIKRILLAGNVEYRKTAGKWETPNGGRFKFDDQIVRPLEDYAWVSFGLPRS